jgi:hypothetical protein
MHAMRLRLLLCAVCCLGSCVSRVPLVLNSNVPSPGPASHSAAGSGGNCELVLVSIRDERSDRTILGSVLGRAVRAPEDPQAWILSALRGLERRGLRVAVPAAGSTVSPGSDALAGEVTLKTFWLTEISTNKAGNAVVHVKLTRNAAVISDQDYRGSRTVTNWSSGDSELQHLVDAVWADAIDKMATGIMGACASNVPAA